MRKPISASLLPLSLCQDCLRKLAEGSDELDSVNLRMPGQMGAQGAHVLAVYCRANKTGAHALIAPGRPLEWTIQSPIDSLRFAQSVKTLPTMYATMFAAYLDTGGEQVPERAELN